jgi:hypothetical protein
MTSRSRATMTLRLIDALEDDGWGNAMSHAAYRLFVQLARRADATGDLATPLSLPRSEIMSMLRCSRATAHRISGELGALGLVTTDPGTMGAPGVAPTYTINVSAILDPSHPRDGRPTGASHERDSGASSPSHQRDPIVPSIPSGEEDAGARAVAFVSDLHQHLSTAYGPGWSFTIDEDFATAVEACRQAGLDDDAIRAACDKAGDGATSSPRSWRFYAAALEAERRDHVKATTVIDVGARFTAPAASTALADLGMDS